MWEAFDLELKNYTTDCEGTQGFELAPIHAPVMVFNQDAPLLVATADASGVSQRANEFLPANMCGSEGDRTV